MNTTPVLASEDEAISDSDINKYVISTEHGDMIEGEISPLWFAHGHHYVYPNEGGVWDYGLWIMDYGLWIMDGKGSLLLHCKSLSWKYSKSR